MRLKGRSSIELAKVFAMGRCPKATTLLGPQNSLSEWRVDMLTGPIPNLGGIFQHRKQFYLLYGSGEVMGCNVFFKDTRWGWFVLDDCDAFDAIDKRGVLLINYDLPENGGLTRDKILDRVRTTDNSDVLIGEFNYALGGHILGPYYFSLTRLPPRAEPFHV
jgi:hypothetical protein